MIRVAADNWYRVQKVGDDITLIDEPHIKPFYRCNIWHIRGRGRDALVDSGMGVVSLREHVSLVTEKRLTAVASHSHFDHIGCHHEFDTRAAHRLEADILNHPTRANTLAEDYATDDIFDNLPPVPYRSDLYSIRTAPVTYFLEDEDILDLGDRWFRVFHLPGHSPGGIALYEEATGILFSGDTIYDGPLVENVYHSNLDDYHASMLRLRALSPRIVHGGHFDSFDGARFTALIEEWLKVHN
ncbi:MBL fold metallo-hydrolase [uncultured Sneathiella sp.]|jgi:glyoxylase-like metal-dependent hydrolase (beta-lactamase superfamily II)|uniref:MBL fold metallo-hydrolase n=1 Tax=uncultured Sneathiella sp. TaxID=879315 RepID=UPI0030DB59A5|tara:strand:+ start:3742 stop:4467 length:726 start_codon:yes stop_codon:yes gene_type:complete